MSELGGGTGGGGRGENGKLWRDRRGVITWWMIELQWRREMRMDGWLGVECEWRREVL